MKFIYKFKDEIIEFEVFDGVYYPQEDSLLLAEVLMNNLNRLKNKKMLEIGCGCGFLSVLLSKLTKNKLLAVDINPIAIKNTILNAKKNSVEIEVRKSNLFSNIHEKFDAIIFNPPYLPVDEDVQWSMFKNKENVIEKFIRDSCQYLNEKGSIILLYSSLSGDIEATIKACGFETKLLGKKKLDWEKLVVVEGTIKQ